MASRWYYAHDGKNIGPCSGPQLQTLAALGRILSGDTVWKEGVEKGSLACKVKGLFPPAATEAPVAELPAEPASEVAMVRDILLPAVLVEAAGGQSATTAPASSKPVLATPKRPNPPPKPVRSLRAVGGKGVVIVGQDGINVKFRKKCTECAHEDTCWHTLRIQAGTTRVSFFCPKCRKKRDGEIQGFAS